MVRQIVLTLLLTALPLSLWGRRGDPPVSRVRETAPLEAVSIMGLAVANLEASLLQDQQEDKSLPLRYAVPLQVDITPATHGTWQQFPDGSRLWRLRFHSPGATDLNLGLTKFFLPDGATLHVSSEEHDYYEGPYTHRDVKPHGELWLPVVPGDRAVLELYVPVEPKSEPDLHLTHVGSGYRDLFGLAGPPNLSKAGECNIDVVCPEGDEWRDQISSVAVYSLSGQRVCTGQMIADASHSFRNFFLTAHHCRVTPSSVASFTVFWNFESAACGDLGGGSLDQNQGGAVLRATRRDVDVTLLELSSDPDPSFGVFYTGWDRSGEPPEGSVAIHHPAADEKAISFNTDTLTTTNSCIGGGGVDTHWLVDNWEEGTTERGSSGSGLWDPDTKKLVGYLSGGEASCDVNAFDCFGKFSEAWDGPNAASRLKDWLDPEDTGVMMVDGGYAPNFLQLGPLGTVDDCGLGSGTENSLWEPGETIELPVTLQSFQALTNVVGTLTTTTPGVTVTRAMASWPDLETGVPAQTASLPFELQLAPSVACFSQVALMLEVHSTEEGPFFFAPSVPVGSRLVPETPLAIPDDGGDTGDVAASTFFVHNGALLNDVDVFVDIEHPWVGDLTISLTSPSGTTVTLLDRPGVPDSSVGCSNNNMQVTFDDDAVTELEDHCPGSVPWFSGEARPVGSLTSLEGEFSGGEWTLTVSDNSGGDTGTIEAWELRLDPPFEGVCQVCAKSREDADLSMTKTPLTPSRPGTARYRVTVRNAGPSIATGVMLVESLHGAVAGIVAPPGCLLDGRRVVCDVGAVVPGAGRSYIIEVARRAPLRGRAQSLLTGSGQVTGNEKDPQPANNQAVISIGAR